MHLIPHFTLLAIIFLWLTSLIAGIIDTLAGGGGLITVPALLITGLPPVTALGTNKLQALVGELNASFHFMHHGHIQIKSIALGIVCAACGALLGALTLRHTHPVLLNKLIPFLTLAILIYIILVNRIIKQTNTPRLSQNSFYLILGLLIGFYNGFFGAGTGSFWVVALMYFLSFDLKKATLYGKPLNFTGNFASVFYFIFTGLINYKIALVMATGQIIGSFIGAKLVIKQGVKIIRPAFILVVSIMTLLLFIKNYG